MILIKLSWEVVFSKIMSEKGEKELSRSWQCTLSVLIEPGFRPAVWASQFVMIAGSEKVVDCRFFWGNLA
jgi:hypothetical protein